MDFCIPLQLLRLLCQHLLPTSSTNHRDNVVLLNPGKKTIPTGLSIAANTVPSSASESEISHYCADKILADAQVKMALILWQGLQQQIASTRLECIPAIQGEIEQVLHGITSNKALDSSIINHLVSTLFDRVNKFLSLQKAFAGKFTEQLLVANSRLARLDQEEDILLQDRAAAHSDLLMAEGKRAELMKELEASNNRITKLKEFILQRDSLLSENYLSVVFAQTEIDRTKNTPKMSEAETSQLDSAEGELKSFIEEFKQFEWHP